MQVQAEAVAAMAEQHQAIVADLGGDITELQRNVITDYVRTRREAHDRWTARPTVAGFGRYFLTGFARCEVCGGSMQAVSRLGKGGIRIFRYCCAHYWNRGAAVCANGRQANMLLADPRESGFGRSPMAGTR